MLDVIDINRNIKKTLIISNIPRTTVYDWITKYNTNFSNLMDKINITINYKIKNKFINIELNKFVFNEIYPDDAKTIN